MSVKAVNADRDNAYIPTVSNLWKSADLLEREVYDFYGIKFLGHKDMRRLYLRSDFNGYPFRKDYDMSPETTSIHWRMIRSPTTPLSITLTKTAR